MQGVWRGRSSFRVSLERHRDSDSVLSLPGSFPAASGETNQATDTQTDIILISHPPNGFSHSVLVQLSSVQSPVSHPLAWNLHLSNVGIILAQFNQHLLQPWRIGSPRLSPPVGHCLKCPPAGSGVYYQWQREMERSVILWINNKNPALLDNITHGFYMLSEMLVC